MSCLRYALPLLLLPFLPFSAPGMPLTTNLNDLAHPGKRHAEIRVDNEKRNFIFATPRSYKSNKPLPLVIFFHGAGGSAQQAAETYGWIEKGEAEHFLVAFPEGLPYQKNGEANFLLNPRIWRDGRSAQQGSPVDDIHFFAVMLDKLQACLAIDPQRIYVTGFSNGASFSFALGARYSDRLAAIAPVCSQSFVAIPSVRRPLPVYYLVGDADPLVPFHGGAAKLPWGMIRTYPPVQESVDAWVRLDTCPILPVAVKDRAGVKVLRYGPGRGHSEILYTVVEGNGHHWPGTVEPLPETVSGPRADPFHATDRIWDFFRQHPLKK